MIRIQQLKLPPNHTEEQLENAIRKSLRLPKNQPLSYEIIRQSIDARKRPDIFYVYTVDVDCIGKQSKCGQESSKYTQSSSNPTEHTKRKKLEAQIVKSSKNKNVSCITPVEYHFPAPGEQPLHLPPVIAGCGPAGLFCGLMLARAGFRPIIIERGQSVEDRQKEVEHFWKTGELNPSSNVQFGEGGAGTFSDGKLNTLVKDPEGRIRFVLKNFIKAGADADILYSSKPHIGTDVLAKVVRNLREEIISLGGEVRFKTQLTDIIPMENGHYMLKLKQGNALASDHSTAADFADTAASMENDMETEVLVLAIGHSARDTFQMLSDRHFDLQAKSFAVGVRVEHPQQVINNAMYGKDCPYEMGAAPYKVTHKLEDGRGVYSFCMCPGGYVVNASSEPGMLAVNGMSYHDRDGQNANSAIVVTVSPEDFGGEGPLAGLKFQRKLERKAYEAGKGKIPVQRFEDFQADIPSKTVGKLQPQMKGAYTPGDVRSIFPQQISQAITEGILSFDRQIKGFADPDTLLSGVESRTSSPVRINRDKQCESGFSGIYPCGEGAGYAGGITSAAMDGIRVAETIAAKFGIDFLLK